MITALAHGAAGIWPVCTIDDAWALKKKLPSALLGGERQGDRIPGFDLGNSPLEYRSFIRHRDIITTTTNGTIALRAVGHASSVIPAAFLNLGTVGNHLKAHTPREILIVCAGTFRQPALEDILAAGMLISLLPSCTLSDSAELVLALYRQESANLLAALSRAKNGRALIAKGRQDEVDWCAQVSLFPLLAQMTPEGLVRAIAT
jgi:2-phosphosulfolactate phosphatase